MQQKKTFATFNHQKNYDIEEYNAEQAKERNSAKGIYNDKVEDILKKLTVLVSNVSDSRTISDAEDLENSKIGQANKNKSMVL